MSSVSETSRTLSSLEEMLEALKQRDENEKPKDCPPALPFRPKLASRTRPPSPKRSMPGTPEKRDIELENGKREEEFKGKLINVFGAKMCKEVDSNSESPYVNSSAQKEYRQRFWENDGAKLDNKLPYSLPKFREDEWDDNISYFIEKKLRVWCHLKNRQWERGQVQSTSGDKASVLLSDGSVVAVPVGELLPANPDILQGVDDLRQLCYLNEPSVLHNLQYRHAQDRIYTKAGPVLIAVNPFKEIQLYGSKFVTAYKQKLLDSPHIYSVAETAYSQIMEDEINQSIIISGESGSGKTETAKFVIEYLVMISGGNNRVESELLQSSYILEAFGNAKTLRNNNSSRFSRVVQLAHGERSYHIFYQLCAGAPSSLRDKLKLKGASEYNFLNQSDSLEIHNVDDAKKFHMLVKALNTAGISERDQEHTFQMVAAVLWLGNITFQAIGNGNNVEVVQCEAVINAASLMGCSANDLMLALSTRKVQTGKDKVVKSLTMQQAIDTRDAMAKFIYANLFDWIVDKINRSLAMDKEKTGRRINILDIYGFESFEEYELDGIDWTKVDFQDNQDCLDLFEKKPIGIISLLDEESNFDKATDLAFANKLKQHLKANPCYRGDTEEFGIRHYAGEVIYDTSGFLNKNRDPVHPDTIQLLSLSSEDLLKLFASSFANQSKKTASSSHIKISDFQKQTVATKFKDVLFKLMQQLESTAPHFICCIKPNNKQVPGMYSNDLVFEQLRSYSLLEVVRICRSGYPTRMTHQEFCIRYGVLLPEDHERKDPLSMSVTILRQYDILPEMYQVGFTKLYFRAGQIAVLEDVRKQVLQGTLEVQKCYSGPHARRDFHELKGVVIVLQSFVRGEIARMQYKDFLESKQKNANKENDEQLVAALQIQSAIRCWLAHRQLNQLQKSKKLNQDRPKPAKKTTEVKQDLPAEILPSVVEDLERRVLVAETTLEEKEKENAALKEQVNQLESRWSDYEARMRSMEEMWQKQMASLQASLVSAKKSLGVDNSASHPGKLEGSPSPCGYESEDTTTTMGTRTPGGSTPIEYASNGVDFGGIREINGGLCVVNYLSREFELRKQNFDDEALAISQLKSGQLQSTSPAEDFRRLRHKFDEWKKDYKARLKETKSKIPMKAQMGLRKSSNKLLTADRGANRIENLYKEHNEQFDHWAFLDQIEAPVWVDLTLECKSAYKDMDEEWFHISHPFHQASSRELKSAFSHSGESSINLEHGIQGSSSPKLPPSVSRSRGKDFRSRQWSQGDQTLTLDKKHHVKHLSKGGLEADKVVEHKTNKKKLTSSAALDSDSACQALYSRDKKISSNSLAAYSDKTRSISSSITSEHGEECYKQELCVSDSSSTITSEACGQKSFEVSGPILGQTTGLLSSLRVSLRKSCVTRQASRMEVNVCRQPEGRKSSSKSRNVTTIVEAKQANKSKVPVQAHNRTSIPKMVTGRTVSSSVSSETSRPKVHPTNVQRKALVPQRANGRVASILVSKPSERIGSSHCRRVVSSGKENDVVRKGISQKSVVKDNQGCSTKFSSSKNENKRSCQSTKSSGFMVNLHNRKEVPDRANVKKKAFY
uniref:Myosin motor domain-containing protein n=1 Tax=Solanum lycopersicum TaxID=4081 RepID=A0A3Q7IBG5_SOLLC